MVDTKSIKDFSPLSNSKLENRFVDYYQVSQHSEQNNYPGHSMPYFRAIMDYLLWGAL